MDTTDPNDLPQPLDAAALNADLEAIENDADVGVEFHATDDGICPDCGKSVSEHEGSGFPVEKLISPEWAVGDEEAKATLTSLVENISSLLAEKFPGVAIACAVSFGGHAGRLMIFPEFLQNIADKPVEDQGKLAVTLFHGIASLGNQAQGILHDIREQLDDATIRSAAKAALAQFLREQAAASAKNEQKPDLN